MLLQALLEGLLPARRVLLFPTGRLLFVIFLELARPFQRTPGKAADTVDYLATAPHLEQVTGRYFRDRKQWKLGTLAAGSDLAGRLRDLSMELVAGSTTP